MTYFLADEKSMEASISHSPTIYSSQKDVKSSGGSTYGVESLETTISSLSGDNVNNTENSEDRRRVAEARRNWKMNMGKQQNALHIISGEGEENGRTAIGGCSPTFDDDDEEDDISRNSSQSQLHQRPSSQATISRPYTPLSFGSPAPRSLMGSPDSRRNSDSGSYLDDIASQAIVSDGDEELGVMDSGLADSGSAPQLVMPSIKMPSRRPFTVNGKNMGRLKVLVAGDSGKFHSVPFAAFHSLMDERHRKIITHKSYRSNLRRYRPCRFSICYTEYHSRNEA
jgi:hypothetical protein